MERGAERAATRSTAPRFDPAQTTFPTVVYKRYTKDWKRPLRLSYERRAGAGGIPGPLIRARVGDKLRIHFKNRDTLHRQPHSMHFHGVEYEPSSDGVYLPLHSGKGGLVRPGQSFTYELTAGRGSAGVWPYHDHSVVDGGLDRRRHVRRAVDRRPRASARADREYLVAFAPVARLPDDQRARVRRQHAGVPSRASATRSSGT